LSQLELAELSARRLKLEFEKRKILEKISRTVSAFDAALSNLLRERFKLEVDLKTTDLRLLLLYQELKLLKEFEKRDQSLAQKLEAKCLEKAEVVSRIAECQERLANKKADIERLNPKQLFGQLQAIVPETHKHAEDLFRIFKKKIKRAKKVAAGEEEDDNEDLSDLDDLDDEEDEEFCPPGCDPALYEQVCELREKRLDQEDVLADLQKAVEALKKDHEALVKKERVIDVALNASEAEIREFQSHKQQELNKLDTVVALKMHQIECLVNGRLPSNLSNVIVFTRAGLTQLHNRIGELEDEKLSLKQQQVALRREHVTLSKSRKAKELKLLELEARARDVQILKFGQEVDLDVIEGMSVNKTADELRAALKKLEARGERELAAWEQRLTEAAAELSRVTKANTEKLARVAELTRTQHRLESELNAAQSKMVTDVGQSRDGMRKEREQLINLVKLQAKEMEALKAEINMLRHKGGHIYTPVSRQ